MSNQNNPIQYYANVDIFGDEIAIFAGRPEYSPRMWRRTTSPPPTHTLTLNHANKMSVVSMLRYTAYDQLSEYVSAWFIVEL